MNLRLILPTLAIIASFTLNPARCENSDVLTGVEASTQSKMTTQSIDWLTSLEKAKSLAKQQGRLIFWVHMLGNIDAYT